MNVTKIAVASITKSELNEAIKNYLLSKNAINSNVTIQLALGDTDLAAAQNNDSVIKATWTL